MNRARLFRRPLSRYGNLRVGKLDSAATIALLLLIIALFYAGSLFFSFYAFASSNAPVQSDKVNSVDLPREHWMELQDIKALKSDPELLLQALRYWEYTAPAEVPEEQINWPENLDDGIERFLTFEVDPGGFNNIRMQFEIVIVMAHMLKRTLVLPPRQRYYLIGDDQAFDAFFDVDALRKVLNVITMDEYLTIHGQEMNSPHDIHEFLRNQPDTYFPKWETWSQFVAIPSIERCEKRYEWSESPWYPDYQSFRASRAPQQISREMLKMKNLHVISDPSKNYRLFGLWYPLFYFENPLWHHYYVKMIRGK